MKNYFYGLFILLSLSACSRTVQSTYYIVRHGEKADDSADPALSEAGLERAQALKKILGDKKISQVYSTTYQRTTQTARPLADAMQVKVETYDPRKQQPFIEDLKRKEGVNVLIVGHSNTLRHIVNGLYEKDTLARDLDERDFDNLFIVKRQALPKKKLSFTARTYGKQTL